MKIVWLIIIIWFVNYNPIIISWNTIVLFLLLIKVIFIFKVVLLIPYKLLVCCYFVGKLDNCQYGQLEFFDFRYTILSVELLVVSAECSKVIVVDSKAKPLWLCKVVSLLSC